MSPTQDVARANIGQLVEKYRGLTDDQKRRASESDVIHQFIVPLFEALERKLLAVYDRLAKETRDWPRQ